MTTTKSNGRPSNADALVICQKSIDGVTKYFGGLTSLSTAGVQYTPATLKGVFQDDIDACKALDAADADAKAKRQAQKAKRKAMMQARRGLKKYIVGTYGEQAVQMLEDFDYPQPKPRVQTAASKAHAVVQAKATRQARGTKGPKAKKAIKGVVPETAPAPAAPAAPTTTK